ncbi:hypothetical protein [Salinibacter ruber]|jgi:hypothetical protein|uniref:Uncharacterized protein n=2 Tax=Salinibacter ruber TaxID=146919 RepID=A0A9X2Z337_9BACT|nr:hypothetical protein [Salinibacter ruber]MBB4088883.1 hypothetical protein [Salinibacter ruber]MCS3614190.1 hypothetical protein [Salinibacter ruber]MCS3626478.1 hypothetical protein [Salinibacter ruber]MCS3629649.1 hypothetical protein [Salinibacter ruber]MCS3634345.1 hypothetical protein [Salinibacter ruber]
MQQTLLALLALLVSMFLSFGQMQSSLRFQDQSVRGEIEQMALGVGMQTIEVVRARAFDSAVIGTGEDVVLDPSSFSDIPTGLSKDCRLHPSQDNGTVQDCQAIGEFNETTGTVPFPLADDSLKFEVEVEVQYVCADLQPCSGPTGRKKVSVFVQDVAPSGQSAALPEPIRYSEVLAYP